MTYRGHISIVDEKLLCMGDTMKIGEIFLTYVIYCHHVSYLANLCVSSVYYKTPMFTLYHVWLKDAIYLSPTVIMSYMFTMCHLLFVIYCLSYIADIYSPHHLCSIYINCVHHMSYLFVIWSLSVTHIHHMSCICEMY